MRVRVEGIALDLLDAVVDSERVVLWM